MTDRAAKLIIFGVALLVIWFTVRIVVYEPPINAVRYTIITTGPDGKEAMRWEHVRLTHDAIQYVTFITRDGIEVEVTGPRIRIKEKP